MRYTLWSRGRLVGHTDLDIYTVTPSMRQGFIEPTPEGRPILEDATCVWRAMAERKRTQRARGGEEYPQDLDLVMAAMRRRDSLHLELRNECDEVFECQFLRVYDLVDYRAGVVDEMCDTEEEEEAKFEIHLSSLSDEERERALAERAEMEAQVEAFAAEMSAEWEEQKIVGSASAVEPSEDPRWETMQYHLQVYL